MRRRDVLALLASSLGLAGCGDNYTWNQKLTVTVNTPEGLKSGSAVTKVSASVGKPGSLSQAVVSYKVSGEATVVDLGHGKYVFALLSSGGDYMPTEYWAAHCFQSQLVKEFSYGDEKKLSELFTKFKTFRGSCAMAGDKFPLLVTFNNLADPKSVRKLNSKNFAAGLGTGFALSSMTLEITDEAPVSGRIDALLPWAAGLAGSIGKGMKLPYLHLFNQINDGSFIRE